MHPWIQLFASHLLQQLPQYISSHNDALQMSVVLVQAFCDCSHMQSFEQACQFLSQFLFKTIKELCSSQNDCRTDLLLCNNEHQMADNDNRLNEHILHPIVTSNSIVIACLTTDVHNKSGEIMLQDRTGSVVACCATLNESDIYKVVMVTEFIYFSNNNALWLNNFKQLRSSQFQYMELGSWVKSKEMPPESDSKKMQTTFMCVSKYNKLTSKPRLINLQGIVIYKSSIHKVSGHNPFFFISLKCQHEEEQTVSVVIQGCVHSHWYQFIHLLNCIQLTNLKLTVVNKHGKDEWKVRCNCAESALSVITVSGGSGLNTSTSDVEGLTQPSGVINYMGVVSESKHAGFGLYSLDEEVMLLISHQPQVHLGRGLRIGARIHVYNTHPIKYNKKLVLCCCTRSCIEIIGLSSQDTPYHPFIAQLHPFSSHCQKLTVQQYMWMIGVVEKIQDSIPTACCLDNGALKVLQAILFKHILQADRPSIFSEFLASPHTCIFTLSQEKKLKGASGVVTVEEFVEYFEKMARNESAFKCNWLHGQEFDRYQNTNNNGGHSNWWYTIVESAMIQPNLLLCGKICLIDGHFKLVDKSGSINVIISTVDSKMVDALVLLQLYQVVVEKYSYEELVKSTGKTRWQLMYRVYIVAFNQGIVLLSGEMSSLQNGKEEMMGRCLHEDMPAKKQMLNQPVENEIQGILIAREFKRQRTQYDVEVHSPHELYVPGIGRVNMRDLLHRSRSLYPFTTSVLILRIQDKTSKKEMSLYIDSNNLPYYFALLPGVHFKVSNVETVTSKTGSVYCKVRRNSVMEICQPPPSSFECLKTAIHISREEAQKAAGRRTLISFVYDDMRKTSICRDLFILFGRISQVQLAVARWSCLDCYKEVADGKCAPGCKGSKRFCLDLRCVIDDGTCEGYLHTERAISCTLLQLSEEDEKLLKSTSYKTAPLRYDRSTSIKQLVSEKSNRSKRQQCEDMLLTRATQTCISQFREFHLKPFKSKVQRSDYPTCVLVCGLTEYHSLSYRKFTFECVNCRPVDYQHLLKTYRSSIKSNT